MMAAVCCVRPDGETQRSRSGASPSAVAQGDAHGFGLGDAGAGQRRVGHMALHARGGVENGFGVAGENDVHGFVLARKRCTSPLPRGAEHAIVAFVNDPWGSPRGQNRDCK